MKTQTGCGLTSGDSRAASKTFRKCCGRTLPSGVAETLTFGFGPPLLLPPLPSEEDTMGVKKSPYSYASGLAVTGATAFVIKSFQNTEKRNSS